jgi:hypothetical protein
MHAQPAVIFLSAALLAPFSATAQTKTMPKEAAFGFTKGMTLKQVRAVAKVEKVPSSRLLYATKTPPAPVIYFRYYVVTVSPKVGVCGVAAVTDDATIAEPVGKAAIERISDSLSAKYGPRAKDPGDGANGDLGVWTDPLGPGTAIRLSANKDRFDEIRSLVVFYYFSNFEACRAEELQGL